MRFSIKIWALLIETLDSWDYCLLTSEERYFLSLLVVWKFLGRNLIIQIHPSLTKTLKQRGKVFSSNMQLPWEMYLVSEGIVSRALHVCLFQWHIQGIISDSVRLNLRKDWKQIISVKKSFQCTIQKLVQYPIREGQRDRYKKL